MSLNDKVSAQRVHIGFFGLRNAGKSSLVNAITGQQLSLVSDIKGTTTDPVKKSMELLPLGPVVIIDTPGIDDEGVLGQMRVQRAKDILSQTDIAVLVTTGSLSEIEQELIGLFAAKNIPYLLAYNKADLLDSRPALPENAAYVSALTKEGVEAFKEKLASHAKAQEKEKYIAADLVEAGDVVILVTPIDSAAPKGRLILPQQQTIRDLLDKGAIPMVCKETELSAALSKLNAPPKLVITDSQAFGKVNKLLSSEIPLTSFSILFARYKGDLKRMVAGAAHLSKLQDKDRILISEGCTHHRQCGDIGTVKLPNWIKGYCGKELTFAFTSGGEFPKDLSPYAMVIHCGGCMLNEREMQSRIEAASAANVPITNYGTAIAQVHGILKRSVEAFPDVWAMLA